MQSRILILLLRLKFTCFRGQRAAQWWGLLRLGRMPLSWGLASDSLSTSAYNSFHIFGALQQFVFSNLDNWTDQEVFERQERFQLAIGTRKCRGRRRGELRVDNWGPREEIFVVHTSEFGNRAPAAMAMLCYVIHEFLILLRGPEPLSQLLLVAARMPPHLNAMQNLGAPNSQSLQACGMYIAHNYARRTPSPVARSFFNDRWWLKEWEIAKVVATYIPLDDWASAEARIEQLHGCR